MTDVLTAQGYPAAHGSPDGEPSCSEESPARLEESYGARFQAWLAGLAHPYLGGDPVELGSGRGDRVRTWLDLGVTRITLGEPDRARRDGLARRFGADPQVRVCDLDLGDPESLPGASYTALVSCGVLSRVSDPAASLRAAYRLCGPGAYVVTVVPALGRVGRHPGRESGLPRRFTRASLAQAYDDAGIPVERVRYVNAPGLLGQYLSGTALGRVPGHELLATVWDRTLVPLARRVERRLWPPFGQVVHAVGRVPGRR